MESMLVLTLLFAVAIAIATFVENDFGTSSARALIYNAIWFEILLFLIGINLIGNIVRYRLWRKEKLLTFVFHCAFIIILIGAGVTRYWGYEGKMHIREGESADTFITSTAFLQMALSDQNETVRSEKPLLLSVLHSRPFSQQLTIESHDVTIKYKKYIADAAQKVVEDEFGEPVLVVRV